MSFLFKQSIRNTAVDPLSPGGVLVEAPTELTQPGILPAGWIIVADGAGGWTVGPQSASSSPSKFLTVMTHSNGVPNAGTRYLRIGQNLTTSVAGFHLTSNAKLNVITVQVNTVDNARSYNIEILKDPAGRLGAPVVLGTLSLPTGTLSGSTSITGTTLTPSDEIGARIVRASGAGSSTFRRIVVITEWLEVIP